VKLFFIVLLAAKPFVDMTVRFQIIKAGGSGINLLAVWGVLAFGVILLLFITKSRKQKIAGKKTIMAFLALNVMVAILAVVDNRRPPVNAFELLIRIITPYLFYFVFSNYWHDPVFKKKLIKFIWLSHFLATTFSVMVYLTGMGFADISQNVNRFSGLYGDSATLSLIAFTSIIFALLYRELFPKEIRGNLKFIFYATLFAYAMIVWLTLTKATILISLALLVLWWGIYKQKKMLIIPLILLGLVAIFRESRVQSRFNAEISFFSSMAEKEVSLRDSKGLGSGRMGRWINTMDIYNDQYNFFEKIFGTYLTFKSHNQYIGFLVQVGALGLFLFLMIMFILIKKMVKKHLLSRNPLNFMGLNMLVSMLLYGLGYMAFHFTGVLWITMILVSTINERPVVRVLKPTQIYYESKKT
jgi:hypothetical protein